MIDISAHGGDVYKNNIELDYSASLNPLGMPEGVRKAIMDTIGGEDRYPDPDCMELRKAIAKSINETLKGTLFDSSEHISGGYINGIDKISYSNVACGNGAVDIIYRLVNYLKPKKALLIAPTFSEYECALRSARTQIVYYNCKPATYDVGKDIVGYIKDDIDIVFLCNPNNPTGRIIDNAVISEIYRECVIRNAFLCIDECFKEYLLHDDIASPIVENVLYIRAFTKMYGMAGIRLGYGISFNEDVIAGIMCGGIPWNVSTIAQVAGVAALKEREHVVKTRALISSERAYLERELKNLGLWYVESQVNYILFKAAIGLKQKLIDRGILIRDCNNFIGLGEGFYRIAIRSHEDNMKLIAMLKEVV